MTVRRRRVGEIVRECVMERVRERVPPPPSVWDLVDRRDDGW